MLESKYLFAFMCCSQRSFKIPEKSLLMAEVSAMGLKFCGDEASAVAELFGINFTTAAFQFEGTAPSARTLLKRLSIAT